MTECPKCKGYGIVGSAAPDILRGRGAIFSSNECDMCHGSGEVPMTNEEWIKSLDTEGLVDYLYEVHKGGDSVERQRWIEKHKERVKMQFRGWLKQPHSEVEK